MLAIERENLGHTYGKLLALDDVTFMSPRIVSRFLGPTGRCPIPTSRHYFAVGTGWSV